MQLASLQPGGPSCTLKTVRSMEVLLELGSQDQAPSVSQYWVNTVGVALAAVARGVTYQLARASLWSRGSQACTETAVEVVAVCSIRRDAPLTEKDCGQRGV